MGRRKSRSAEPKKDSLPVYCAHREMIDPTTLVPHPRNPNRHPAKQIELLAKIIAGNGWRAPIVLSNRSGFIVRGHARQLAALHLHATAVPVDRQDYASDEEELADLIADNRIAELAHIDDLMLRDGLQSLSSMSFDLDLTGFDEASLNELTDSLDPKTAQPNESNKWAVLLPCNSEQDQLSLLARFAEEGRECRAITS